MNASDSPLSPARLEYFLADRPGTRIFTTAPLHPGDVVVMPNSGSPAERIVARTQFSVYPDQPDDHLLAAFVHFEKEAERVGGV